MQELKNKKDAVVVFSGGQDSTTCLFWALKDMRTSSRFLLIITRSISWNWNARKTSAGNTVWNIISWT